jgi:hypothetical protein
MKLADAPDVGDFQAAPAGKYRLTCTSAEEKISKAGAPMIALVWAITDGEHAGKPVWDYIITDSSFKGAAFGKKKLTELGIDCSVDCSDADLCGQFLNMEVGAVLGVEQAKDASGTPKWTADASTGKQKPQTNNKVVTYTTEGAVAQAPAAKPVAQAPAHAPAAANGAGSPAVPPWQQAANKAKADKAAAAKK